VISEHLDDFFTADLLVFQLLAMGMAPEFIYVFATAIAMFCLFCEICKLDLNVAVVSFFPTMFKGLKKWLGWGPTPGPVQCHDHSVLSDQIPPMAAGQLYCMHFAF
jgi:hypothetical protein